MIESLFSLSIGLTAIACLSLVTLVVFSMSKKNHFVRRLILCGYVSGVATVLCGVVAHYIGLESTGSPLIQSQEPALLRRIEHRGYYVAANSDFVFIGATRDLSQGNSRTRATGITERAFYLSNLPENEIIRCRPSKGSVQGDLRWDLVLEQRTFPTTFPLRANGRCVNLPEDSWFRNDDTLMLVFGGRFISLRWLRQVESGLLGLPGRTVEQFFYNQGSWRRGQAILDGPPSGIKLPSRLPNDGLRLTALLRTTQSEDFVDKWHKHGQGAVTLPVGSFWEQARQILIVREVRGKQDSRLGVLHNYNMSRQTDLAVLKNNAPITPPQSLIKKGFTELSYGFGGETWALNLPQRGMSLEASASHQLSKQFAAPAITGSYIYEAHFTRPRSWPLPPSAVNQTRNGADKSLADSSRFILTSSTDYIPLDGYYLETGNDYHAFYATAAVAKDFSTLELNDGKNNYNGRRLPRLQIGTPVRLGDNQQGVIIAYAAPKPAIPFAGKYAIQIVVILTILFCLVIGVAEKHRATTHLDVAWTLLWGISLTLLSVRLILGYRASLLPPGDATLGELTQFHKSLAVSLWGLGLLPLGLLMVRVVAAWRGGLPVRTWLRARVRTIRPLRRWLDRRHSRGTKHLSKTSALGLSRQSRRSVTTTSQATRDDDAANPSAVSADAVVIPPTAPLQTEDLSTASSLPTHQPIPKAPIGKSGRGAKLLRFLRLTYMGIVALLPYMLIIAANGEEEIFIGSFVLRTSMMLFLTLMFVLCVWGSCITQWRSVWIRLGGWLWLLLPIFLAVLTIKDTGSMLYLLPLIFITPTICARSQAGPLGSVAAGPLLVAAFFIICINFPVFQPAGRFAKSIETPSYRLFAFHQVEKQRLLSGLPLSSGALRKLKENSQQAWQMRLYSANGAHDPAGYGQILLSKKGMTYPTALADCVFSTFLLAEHGKLVSALVVLLYIGLTFACIYGAWHLPEERMLLSRALPLLAIGTYFSCHALFMAAANVELVPFTGQNVPLMSIYSASDLLQGGLLLAMVTWLMRAGVGSQPLSVVPYRQRISGGWSKLDKDRIHSSGNLVAFLLPARQAFSITFGSGSLLLLVLVLLLGCLWQRMGSLPSPNDPSLQSYNLLDGEIIKLIKSHLPNPSSGGASALALDARTYTLKPTLAQELTPFEIFSLKEFNNLTTAEKQQGREFGLYRLERRPGGKARVTVDATVFKVSSPLEQRDVWAGAITTGDKKDANPTLSVLGRPFSLRLNANEPAESISLTEPNPLVGGQSVKLLESRGNQGLAFGQISRDSKGVHFKPIRSVDKDISWVTYYNGERIEASNQPKKLDPFHIVVIERTSVAKGQVNSQKRKERWNLLYQGPQTPALAFRQWRNGVYRREWRESGAFPPVYAIANAADNAQKWLVKQKEIRLTIDLPLQKSLQNTIKGWALAPGQKPEYLVRQSSDAALSDMRRVLKEKMLSVTVMDAFSGRILALGSWPAVDLSKEDLRHQLESAKLAGELAPREEERLRTDLNFLNHEVGSTIKPIIYSATAASFYPNFNVGELEVHSHPQGQDSKGRWLHQSLGKIRFDAYAVSSEQERPTMTMRDFLVNSRAWPACILGFLGTLSREDYLNKVMIKDPPPGKQDIVYKKQRYALDFTRLPQEISAFTLKDNANRPRLPRPHADNFPKGLLFHKLDQFMKVQINPTSSDDNLRLRHSQSFLPAFNFTQPVSEKTTDVDPALEKMLAANYDLQRLAPETIRLEPHNFQNVRKDYINFLIGAGHWGRFNNVAMTEAAARLATGRKIEATLSYPTSMVPSNDNRKTPNYAPLPSPLNDSNERNKKWREDYLISYLRDVGETGTAKFLRGQSDRYVALYKTGTIQGDSDIETSEAFMFVIGEYSNKKRSFVRERTVAGFIYMKNSRLAGSATYAKRSFAQHVVREVVTYLDRNKKAS